MNSCTRIKKILLQVVLFPLILKGEKTAPMPPAPLEDAYHIARVIFTAIDRSRNYYVHYEKYELEGMPDERIRELLHFFLLCGLPDNMRIQLCQEHDAAVWGEMERERILQENKVKIGVFAQEDVASSPWHTQEDRTEHFKRVQIFKETLFLDAEKRPLDKTHVAPCVYEESEKFLNRELSKVCLWHYLPIFGDQTSLAVLQKMLVQIRDGELPEDDELLGFLFPLYSDEEMAAFLLKHGAKEGASIDE